MAAAHVTGAWAIMKQSRAQATVTQVLDAFVAAGIGVLDGRNGITTPRIQVNAALKALVPSPARIR